MAHPPAALQTPPPPKALIFDLMGTCTDWLTAITTTMSRLQIPALQSSSPDLCDKLARRWRAGFFEEIHARFAAGVEGEEDIDVTHRRILDRLLDNDVGEGFAMVGPGLGDREREGLVRGWHEQVAWPDSIDAIERLGRKHMVIVLANGTTRLQLDIIRSSGLRFHTLLSSQLLNLTKPSPEIYTRALALLAIRPDEALMVAAHAYDLRAARKVGMKTAYIDRSTEDEFEDRQVIKGEVDLFLCGSRPLGELADLMMA